MQAAEISQGQVFREGPALNGCIQGMMSSSCRPRVAIGWGEDIRSLARSMGVWPGSGGLQEDLQLAGKYLASTPSVAPGPQLQLIFPPLPRVPLSCTVLPPTRG